MTQGHSWNSAVLFDSGGNWQQYVSNNSVSAYDPDEATAWIRVGSWDGPHTYTLTTSLIVAPAQNDAASGRDAPRPLHLALPITAGVITGSVVRTHGDMGDTYRLDTTPGDIIDVHSAVNGEVVVYNHLGEEVGEADYPPWCPCSATLVGDGTPLYLSVTWGTNYHFTVDVSRPADLRVDSLDVRPVTLETDVGTTGLVLRRDVAVTVTNHGAGPTRGATLQVIAEHDGPTADRVVGTRALDLAPGESATFVLPWDTTGQVGEFTLVARVASQFESALDDNEARAGTSILARGLPFSLDLLNHEVRAGANVVRVEYGGDRIGLGTPAGFRGIDRGALVLA